MNRLRMSTGRPARNVKGRSGSMLLLVLVIMAVAVILITSALTITVNGRMRFYRDSQASQARLTATSTAKTIADAIVAADFKSIDLENLAKANGYAGTTVTVQSAQTALSTSLPAGTDKTKAVAPGLYNNVLKSNTTAQIQYYPTGTTQYISIKVTTGLDYAGNAAANSESVTVYLQKTSNTLPSGAFSNLVTLGANTSQNDLPQFKIGFDLKKSQNPGTYVKPEPNQFVRTIANYIVLHGNVSLEGNGASTFYSDMIYTGTVTLGNDSTFYGNQIFSGDLAALKAPGEGGPLKVVGANVLFLGDTPNGGSVYRDASNAKTGVSWNNYIQAAGMYLSNTTLTSALSDSSIFVMPALVIDPGATAQFTAQYFNPIQSGGLAAVYPSSPTTSGYYTPETTQTNFPVVSGSDALTIVQTLRALAATYNSPTMKGQIERTILTQQQALDANLTTYKTEAEVRSAAAAGLITQITGATLTSGTRTIYDHGSYYIDASTDPILGGNSALTTLEFRLFTNDITLYIIGNGNTFTIDRGLIRFDERDEKHTGKICLMDGVKIDIAPNSSTFDVGIIGSHHIANPSAGNKTKTDLPEHFGIFLYIYGMNNNSITVGASATLEGYVGLYGNSGTVDMQGGAVFYGRIESTWLTHTNGGEVLIPYGPSPSDYFGSAGGQYAAITNSFEVEGYKYS